MQQAFDIRTAKLYKGQREVAGDILNRFAEDEDEIARALRTAKAGIAEMRNVLRDVKGLSTTKPIDPDNEFSDLFLQYQRDIKDMIEEMDAWLKDHPQLSEPLRAGHDELRKALVQWHMITGELRANILEHDANCSGTIGTFDLEKTFSKLRDAWKAETRYTSSALELITNKHYQRIIGLGPKVIPLILAALAAEPDHWSWALQALTGENPVQPEDSGNLPKMAQAWLAWAKARGLRA